MINSLSQHVAMPWDQPLKTPPRIALTGAPCSGKSTTATALGKLGYTVVPETAREVIRELKSSQPDLSREKFISAVNREVLIRQLRKENTLAPEDATVLDRGFGDLVTYRKLYGESLADFEGIRLQGRYRKVVVLSPLPFVLDDARHADEAKIVDYLDKNLPETYYDLGYDVVRIPVASERTRVGLILRELRKCGLWPIPRAPLHPWQTQLAANELLD